MNKEKIKNIVIIVESVLLGLVATMLAIGGIKSSSAKSTGISPESGVSVAKQKAERRDDGHFKYMTDQQAYETYFAPLVWDSSIRPTYGMRGFGPTNVVSTDMDFIFTNGSYVIGYIPATDSTTYSWVTKNETSLHVYYLNESYTYGVVAFEFGDGTVYKSYLKNLADTSVSYNSYLPNIRFTATPTPDDYWNFIKYFYTYWSAYVNISPGTSYVKPYVNVDWLNLYPSTNEYFIVGYQTDTAWLRVVANLDNLKIYGKTTNYYQGSSSLIDLGDLYFDYDGNLCYLPTTGVSWNIFFYSSSYFYHWFMDNTFTVDEWNNGLYYPTGNMNVITKYLYEDIEDFSSSSGTVTEIDGLRYRVYKTNQTSMTSVMTKFTLVKTVLASNDTKYILRCAGSDTRVDWADNTDAGDYIISYADGGTSLNFKYGLSSRIQWDNCVISCQESYTLCKYFAPYYSTVLQDGKATTDGSSLTDSAFANTFILLGDAFDACFGWLNVEVFPGVTLFGLLMVPFIVTLIVLVFKVVKK